MGMKLVIVRHLEPHMPVVTAVFAKPENMTDDHFVSSDEISKRADTHIETFCDEFVEFKEAKFYKYFIEEEELW